MKKRWKNAMKELRENRGSGVVLVLVAISCITLMTTSLLHLSYTAFKIKASERQSETEFYEADALLDELVTKIQDKVSIAIAEAHKVVLIEYEPAETVEAVETDVFLTAKNNRLKEIYWKELEKRVTSSEVQKMLEAYDNVVITYDGTSEFEDGSFVLKDVGLSYTSIKSGSTTSVEADIVISAPLFNYRKVGTGVKESTEWDIESMVSIKNWSTS